MSMLLVVDGPLKGQLVEGSQLPLVYYQGKQPRSYWQHSWTLLGRVINVLSIHADATSIDLGALWEAIASEDARAAAGWLLQLLQRWPRWRSGAGRWLARRCSAWPTSRHRL